MNNKIKKIFLLLGDISMLYISLYLTLLLRYRDNFSVEIWQNHYPPFTYIFIAWLFLFYFLNLYNLYFTQNSKIFYRSIIKSIGIAGVIAALFFYLNPSIGIAPKINLLLYILVFSFVFSLWRFFYNSILFSYLPKNRIAFIGVNDQISEIIYFLKANPNAGYKPLLIIDAKSELTESYHGIKTIRDISNLKDDIKRNHINTIVLSTNPDNSSVLRQQLFSSLSLKLDFINSINFYELIIGKVPIDAINQMWFLENLNEGGKALFDRTKSIFDFLFALSILLLTLPFWILIIIIIKIESHGPVFFKQIRISKDGKEFSIIKFRTMKIENNNFAPTTKNDSRITSFGSFLRKSRIDEIPQALNILKGEMSFVGPRPERPEIIKDLEKVVPFYKERMLVKPGLTGWDQVSGEYHSPSVDDTLKKLQYDLYYVKNRSIYLDTSILLKTISVVMNRAGM
ncbi:MAG: exopolysaccharide biosynthesis polyprenyl glycosylphosphotransferase [Patescibacteria group bacterium]|jgi:exopolysaccharide biosynthesis polyprenyl glycosylphosphotransferase|nr:exopolysaccharide biosynthesis polyprenyl glycosylphosphotransferase [Patescibacteria group bacterium]